jgi:hypothetical protein
MSEISFAKDNLLNPVEYTEEYATDFRKKELARIYALYQKKLKVCNIYTIRCSVTLHPFFSIEHQIECLNRVQENIKAKKVCGCGIKDM